MILLKQVFQTLDDGGGQISTMQKITFFHKRYGLRPLSIQNNKLI
jgi:hypothetical protein